jgi:hypothetical protein
MIVRWTRQAVQSFVAAQKILMELTAQQNALVIGLVREQVKRRRGRPGKSLARMAGRSVTGVTGAGKVLLDLAEGETTVVVEGMKDGLRLSAVGGMIANLVRHRVDALLDLVKHLLDAVADQISAIVDSYGNDEALMAGSRMKQLARTALERFVETEKKFLDAVALEVRSVTEPGRAGRKAVPDRSKVLTKLAKQSVDQFIEAQKKLAALAIEQIEAASETEEERVEAAKAAEEAKAELRATLAELTQKSVENLVSAQKSLLDLAIKPAGATAMPARRTPAKRGRPRRKGVVAA